jgi:hypothetical protein
MAQRTDTASGAPSLADRGPSGDGAGRSHTGVHERDKKEALPQITERELEARVRAILNRWPTVGLALGVVRDGRLAFFYGHGLADIASHTPSPRTPSFGSPPSPRPSRPSP